MYNKFEIMEVISTENLKAEELNAILGGTGAEGGCYGDNCTCNDNSKGQTPSIPIKKQDPYHF